MKIVNMNNENINAAFIFTVGNCEISVSTVFKKNVAEIAIFEKHSNELLKYRPDSIQDAISWVNTYGPRD